MGACEPEESFLEVDPAYITLNVVLTYFESTEVKLMVAGDHGVVLFGVADHADDIFRLMLGVVAVDRLIQHELELFVVDSIKQ